MLTADPLSRRPDHEEGVNVNNTNKILLRPEFFRVAAIDSSHDSPINNDLILKEIKEALLNDNITQNYRDLLKSGPREFSKQLQDWNYENGLLLHCGKVYIPKSQDEDLRQCIVQMHYDCHGMTRVPNFAFLYALFTRP